MTYIGPAQQGLRKFVAGIEPTLETVLDSFSDTKAAGAVVGSLSPSGALRGGVDAEGVMYTQDHHLVLPGLSTNGWARQGIIERADTPYVRANGVTLVCRLLDGDVQAQDPNGLVNKHIAIGLFGSATPSDPVLDGHAFIISNDGANGGLVSRNGSDGINQTSLINNVAIYQKKQDETVYIIELRDTGAMYYAYGLPNARGLPASGMRAVHFAALNKTTTPLYPGVYQRHALGGPTLVDVIDVVTVPDWATNWFSTADVADLFTSGTITAANPGRTAAIGGTWRVTGVPQITANGVSANGAGQYTDLYKDTSYSNAPAVATGLFTCQVVCGANAIPDFGVVLTLRKSSNSYYWVSFNSAGTTFNRTDAGVDTQIGSPYAATLSANTTYTIVIIDDGASIQVWRDNTQFFNIPTTTYAANTGLGILLINSGSGQSASIKNYEAHPRSMPIPAEIATVAGDIAAYWPTFGTTTVYADTFGGAAGPLEGTTTSTGSGVWDRTLSQSAAAIKLNGSGKAYRDTAVADSGAILYTLPWSSAHFADLALDATPSGSAYGTGNNARAGVVFWQDPDHWLGPRVYVADDQVNAAEIEIELVYDGASVTVLRRVNFGVQINHGVLSSIRMAFDGNKMTCWLYDATNAVWRPEFTWMLSIGRPAHTPWLINRVGIQSNGADVATLLDNFRAWSA